MKLSAVFFVSILLSSILPQAHAAQPIAVTDLASPPVLDGEPNEWSEGEPVEIILNPTYSGGSVSSRTVLMRVGRYQDLALFYFEWPDEAPDLLHKPFVWDAQEQRYQRGPQREDRLAVQFEINGDYRADWLAAQSFVADTWHWKASRSNPLGLAHDKSATLSRKKLLRAYRAEHRDGGPVYILREDDQGTPLYTTARYGRYAGDLMPKYVLARESRGSIADVQAKGVWHDGRWHLELLRSLDTGHADDARFVIGQAIRAGVAVFDRSENPDHVVSPDLLIQF